MLKKLEGSFKGLRFITTLRATIRGKRKDSWAASTDVTDLVKFSKVR